MYIQYNVNQVFLSYNNGSASNLLRNLKSHHPFELTQYEPQGTTAAEASSTTCIPTKPINLLGLTRVTPFFNLSTIAETLVKKTKYKPGCDRKSELDNLVLNLVTQGI